MRLKRLFRSNLSLWHEDGDRVVFPWRYGKFRDTLHPQFVPNFGQIVAFVDLDFICDHSGTELLIECVLQVPTSLVLLHELAYCLSLRVVAGRRIFNDAPDFEVLDCVTRFIFRRSLPGYDVGSQRGKSKLIDILRRQRVDDVSFRRIDYVDTRRDQP